MEQQLALAISLGLITAIGLAFLFTMFRSKPVLDYPPLQHRAYQLRSRLFLIVVALVLPVLLYTLVDLPYARAHALSDAKQIQVVGHQWYWTVDDTEIEAGSPVVFNISSADVNHGFGIYDASMRLVTQTQAMPGYVNRLAYTFEKPGTYKVLCLEFCGTAHHVMAAELHVKTASNGNPLR
jgi:cytochrome c oxidase subunit 2